MLYLGGFLIGYVCVLLMVSLFNISVFLKIVLYILNCYNFVVFEKNSCMKIVLVVNIIFNCFVFGEIIYFLVCVLYSCKFMFDLEFCLKYFFYESLV